MVNFNQWNEEQFKVHTYSVRPNKCGLFTIKSHVFSTFLPHEFFLAKFKSDFLHNGIKEAVSQIYPACREPDNPILCLQ